MVCVPKSIVTGLSFCLLDLFGCKFGMVKSCLSSDMVEHGLA